MAKKIKLLVGGPCESGKTYLSNVIADASEISSGANYHATKGVRILEFEKKEKLGGETTLIDIELWDCGGDKDYETCWPVFRQDAKGLILVYDPSLTTDRSIDKWYKYFIKQNPSMNDTNCVLFALHKPTNHKKTSEWKAPTSLQSVRCTHVEMSSDNYGTINETFSDFIRELLVAMKMKQESDEVKIVGKKRK